MEKYDALALGVFQGPCSLSMLLLAQSCPMLKPSSGLHSRSGHTFAESNEPQLTPQDLHMPRVWLDLDSLMTIVCSWSHPSNDAIEAYNLAGVALLWVRAQRTTSFDNEALPEFHAMPSQL